MNLICLNFTKTDRGPFDTLFGSTLVNSYSFFLNVFSSLLSNLISNLRMQLETSVLPSSIKSKPNQN